MNRSNERSPIKDRPLRQPGQSLEEERRAIWDDKLEPVALLALVLGLIALLEWWREWMQQPPAPWLYTIAASGTVAFAAWRIRRHLPRLRAIKQGLEGEKAVGQFLERLRERGYQVFHDVVGPNFNVDHVLIGPAGIFTVETKTWSKPSRGDARVTGDVKGPARRRPATGSRSGRAGTSTSPVAAPRDQGKHRQGVRRAPLSGYLLSVSKDVSPGSSSFARRLLLTPTIDHLFDRGFIGFEDDGTLIVSPVADRGSLVRMGIETERVVNVGAFSSGQRAYLDFHRDAVCCRRGRRWQQCGARGRPDERAARPDHLGSERCW